MIVKQVHLGDSGQEKLRAGIKKIAGAVKSTLGARGRTVLIESENHVGGITVTKDGVTVAKSINLYDPTENLAVMMIRQAAEKTATMSGDGTTTSIVLAEAIIDAAQSYIDGSTNVTEVIREINSIAERIDAHLKRKSKKVSGKRLRDVATISANNDRKVGEMIAGAFEEVEMVTVENSMNSETYVDIVKGMRVERGYTSKYFITDQKKQECVMENPYVLITDHEISNLANIEEILKPIVAQNKSLLIIGELSQNVLNTLNVNALQGKIKVCNIIPPNFGYRKKELLEDLAIALGGTYFSDDTGDDLSVVQMGDLGRAAKIVVRKDMTVIMQSEEMGDTITDHVEVLKKVVLGTDQKEERDFLQERIANLSGGIGVIHVGALTDIEQKEKRDRIDDAVCAVQAAIDGGILPGGGIALLNSISLINDDSIASKIFRAALFSPFSQILENAGLDGLSEMTGFKNEYGVGYDVKNDRVGDMIKMGIIDPANVTRNALENAVSVATTIMSTSSIITNVRDNGGTK
jgi:chaperonin GroEL